MPHGRTHRRYVRTAIARTTASILMAAAGLAVAAEPAVAAPAVAGVTFTANPVATGLNQPVAFTFAPNGRIFYVEKASGEIRIYNPDRDTDRLFYDVPRVNAAGERGTLGIALHPAYPERPFVFVFATRSARGSLKNQILRLTNNGGSGEDRRTIFSTRATSATNHNGGRILFGPDNELYAVVGEGGNPRSSQNLSNPRGKILRMTPLGRRPRDNPIPRSKIFAYGIRNSFGFAFDPVTAELWQTENGPACNDEVNRVAIGGRNYGWGPRQDCGSLPTPRDTNNSGPKPRIMPELWFRQTVGITGITFCDGCGLTGSEGDMFFGDVRFGQIRRVPLDAGRDTVAGVGSVILDTDNVLSMETGPGGGIYFSDFSGIYRLRD
jgi:glucose/arabinose dehydrogenase